MNFFFCWDAKFASSIAKDNIFRNSFLQWILFVVSYLYSNGWDTDIQSGVRNSRFTLISFMFLCDLTLSTKIIFIFLSLMLFKYYEKMWMLFSFLFHLKWMINNTIFILLNHHGITLFPITVLLSDLSFFSYKLCTEHNGNSFEIVHFSLFSDRILFGRTVKRACFVDILNNSSDEIPPYIQRFSTHP